jgi:hypothetical protein
MRVFEPVPKRDMTVSIRPALGQARPLNLSDSCPVLILRAQKNKLLFECPEGITGRLDFSDVLIAKEKGGGASLGVGKLGPGPGVHGVNRTKKKPLGSYFCSGMRTHIPSRNDRKQAPDTGLYCITKFPYMIGGTGTADSERD